MNHPLLSNGVPYLLVGTVVFLLFWLVGKGVKKVINKVAVQSHSIDDTLASLVSRIVSIIITIFGFLAASVVIFPSFKPGDIIAGLGITWVAIGFAFKDILQNFFAGILILWRRPFKVGDQIKVKEYEGTVEEINMRSTRLKTYDGERAMLPNGDVYTSSILVRTAYSKRRIKFVVGIGYPDSMEEARTVIHRVLNGIEVLKAPGSWVYVSELERNNMETKMDMKPGNYRKFFLMLGISYLVMYGVMYLNVDRLDHIYVGLTRLYMTALMVAPMALIMLGFMGDMYKNRRTNELIIGTSIATFVGVLFLLRTQTWVDDKQYMKSMIPHHSSAIMVSQAANLKDPEVRKLAKGIIESQEREIAEMKAILARMEK